MSPDRWKQVEELFQSALNVAQDERDRFLANACKNDSGLRVEVESLLAIYPEAASFIEKPVLGTGYRLPTPNEAGDTSPDSVAGRFIGHYRLRKLIATGGMGVVYEAEQENPRRAVALKVVRGGEYVDEHRVKLFQREAQTLARLKHPYIASIFEAGRTEGGEHFFAMELVRGVTLMDYVESERPSTNRRLELFQAICDAINYAHQRGVMHRDLKPANILIDTDGNPKVLDFGLAKITDSDMAATTMVTEIGKIQGTLNYMSPEQARGNPDEIDLRSDVYSLGIILYELLTEQLPYEVDRAILHEALRVICEEEPRKPSTINRALRGDLETIALKALEKNPVRRYQSASALAEDIERYQHKAPILARPPSAMYQMQKLVARHKLPFAFATVLLVLVLSFGVVATILAGQKQEEARKANLASDFLKKTFLSVNPDETDEAELTALREVLANTARRAGEELSKEPEVEAAVRDALGIAFVRLGAYEAGEAQLRIVLEKRRKTLGVGHQKYTATLIQLARAIKEQARFDEAEALYREALRIRTELLGQEHEDVAEVLNNLGQLFYKKRDFEQATPHLREALRIRRLRLDPNDESVVTSMANVGSVLSAMGKYAEAEELLREALRLRRARFGVHTHTVVSLNKLGLCLRAKGDFQEAEEVLREALKLRIELLGQTHEHVAISRHNLALVLHDLGKYAEAEKLFREAIELWRDELGGDHPHVARSLHHLSELLHDMGRDDEADECEREALAIRDRASSPPSSR